MKMSLNMLEEGQKITDAENVNHENTDSVGNKPKIWLFIEENWPTASQLLALVMIFLLSWGIASSLFPGFVYANSPLMRIFFLFAGAQACGILMTFVGLPDMLGMIAFGVLYKNVGFGNFEGYEKLEAVFRELALVCIMLLAGLSLDLDSFKKLFAIIMRLTFIPTIFEVSIVCVCSHFFLNFPWLWGVLLGLVVTAISPNVVVTVLLKLKEERLGMNKGIHTVIIAVTSCNDIFAIFFFGVTCGIVFSSGDLTHQLLQGPVGIVMGCVFGFLSGLLVVNLPSYKSTYSSGLRFISIFLCGTLSVMGSKYLGFPSAGSLGCLVASVTARTGWTRMKTKNASFNCDVEMYLNLLWKFLKPVSFSLIGKEVNFSVLTGSMLLYGFLILSIGVIFRILSGYLSFCDGNMNWREKAYITISGFPKATVQAALGPVALDLARSQEVYNEQQHHLAESVLVISVIAIILTAPLGALLMTKLAPKWLQRSNQPDEINL